MISRGRIVAVVIAVVTAVLGVALPAHAQPQGAHITGIEHVNDRWDKVSVFSRR
jgi:hypothetical protein